jgi:glyoxylase-like metal-dependent hydrolase (beta-lactamase superfamily II)
LTYNVVNVIVYMYTITTCPDGLGGGGRAYGAGRIEVPGTARTIRRNLMRSIVVGEVEITALTDVEGPFFKLSQLFPGVRAEQWSPYLGRYPWAFADAHTLYGRVGSYLLRSPGHALLVDTGIGPGTMGMRGRLLEDLARSGIGPEDVDTVFLTHLHGDHVGWSFEPDGGPTFSGARYVTQEAEWEAAEPYLRRAMSSLEDLGVLELVDGEEFLTEEFTAIPTPGHSPGHASLFVSSGGEQALVVGDVISHPAQVTEPTWNVAFDADKEQASFTRVQLLDWLEDDGIAVAAGHIPGSGFGHVVREEGRRYWRPLETVARTETLGRHSTYFGGG